MNDKPSKVVIVEDNVSLADIYKTLLTSDGFETYVAVDGREAVNLISEKVPDLVLLDIMLPELPGDKVLAEIRNNPKTSAIKVIMLTNLSETEAPEGLDKLGFSRYIIKANLQSDQLPVICRETIAEGTEENVEFKAL